MGLIAFKHPVQDYLRIQYVTSALNNHLPSRIHAHLFKSKRFLSNFQKLYLIISTFHVAFQGRYNYDHVTPC